MKSKLNIKVNLINLINLIWWKRVSALSIRREKEKRHLFKPTV